MVPNQIQIEIIQLNNVANGIVSNDDIDNLALSFANGANTESYHSHTNSHSLLNQLNDQSTSNIIINGTGNNQTHCLIRPNGAIIDANEIDLSLNMDNNESFRKYDTLDRQYGQLKLLYIVRGKKLEEVPRSI